MSFLTYMPIIFLWIVLFIIHSGQKRNRAIIARKIIKKRKDGTENKEMIELAKRFIGKECLIYQFDGSHQYDGVVKEVVDGAVLLEKDGKIEAINLDFVIRIREYPKNKKGNKKSVVLD